jgi:hypothetical protein
MKAVCDVHRGQETYTSLINVGLSKTKADWNFIVFAGSMIRPNFWVRYSMFLEDDKDILFPVVGGQTNFIDGSMNGILLHGNVLKRVGRLPEISNLEQAKTVWAYTAIKKGCRFKGVLSSRIVG